MADDILSFDSVKQELGLDEEELKRLIADGEMPAIKDGDTFVFKRDVVDAFKESRKGEPTIVLSDEEDAKLNGDDDFDRDLSSLLEGDDDLLEVETAEPAAGKKEEKARAPEKKPEPAATGGDETILSIDGLLEDEDLLESEPAEKAAPPVESDSLLEGEGLDLLEGDDAGAKDQTLVDSGLLELEEDDTFQLEAADEDLLSEEEVAVSQVGAARPMQAIRKEAHPLTIGGLALTTLVLLAPTAILLNLMHGQGGAYPEWIGEWFYDSIGKFLANLFF